MNSINVSPALPARRNGRRGAPCLKLAGTVAAAFALVACAQIPDVRPYARMRDGASLGLPQASQVADEKASPGSVAAQSDALASEAWWQALGSTELNALIEEAMSAQPRLGVARARWTRAQAALAQTQTRQQPSVNASADATYQHYTANGAIPRPLAGSERISGNLQLTGSWEWDFFGKNQAAIDAMQDQAQAAQADMAATRLLLASQIASAYVELARLGEQEKLAERALAQRLEIFRLVQARVKAGLDTAVELRQSEGAIPDARVQLALVQERNRAIRLALAALMGRPQSADQIRGSELAGFQKPAPALTLPADLLGRRADVAAAKWRVQAAMHDVVQARAQFYPNLNLVAFAGLSSIGIDRLIQTGSQQWGVGPALRLPLFDGGFLRAQLASRSADLDAAIETYNATVVDAVSEVARQLNAENAAAEQRSEQASALNLAESAYGLALERYRAGLGNYLQVLSAENLVLAQRRSGVDLWARSLDTAIGLMRALGGGYAESPLPQSSLAQAAVLSRP